jgi:hypothetical protein
LSILAAEIGAMDRQTLRDSAHRFNAKGPEPSFVEPDSLIEDSIIAGRLIRTLCVSGDPHAAPSIDP